MSHTDFAPALAMALDRFDAPQLRADFADRVMAASRAPLVGVPRASPRRDRRGMWKRGRQMVIGTFAVGLLSAAAVASGLLGAAGIRVPLLTAMLAPHSVVELKPPAHHFVPVHRQVAKTALAAAAVHIPLAPPPIIDPGPLTNELQHQPAIAQRVERAAERRTFVLTHPEFAGPLAANARQRRALLFTHPGLAQAIAAGADERRAFLATHPGVADKLRTQRRERLALLGDSKPVSPPAALSPSSAPLVGPPVAEAPRAVERALFRLPERTRDAQTPPGGVRPINRPFANSPERARRPLDLRERRAQFREFRVMRRQRFR